VALGAIFVWRAQQIRASFEPPPVVAGKSKRAARGRDGHSHGGLGSHSHSGSHSHNHGDQPDHEHDTTPQLQRRDVAILGIVGGLVPSGSALILLLSSIALNEVLYGLLLIVAFGLGMAAVLIGITTGVVLMRSTPVMGWERWRGSRLQALASWLPTISGLVVVALGFYLTLDALRNLR
jgi:ABC-type nickel/cobalt efflux system permease component RcnA